MRAPSTLALLLAVTSCGAPTPCVVDVDCPSGSRCNASNTCQLLFSGSPGDVCSADHFCQNRDCKLGRCWRVPAETSMLGSTQAQFVTWAGPPGVVGSVQFSNQPTACGSREEPMPQAFLSMSGVTTPGEYAWYTDDAVRRGAPSPRVSFARDTLSGLQLHQREGLAVIQQLPESTGQGDFVFALIAADGGVFDTFRARPWCP